MRDHKTIKTSAYNNIRTKKKYVVFLHKTVSDKTAKSLISVKNKYVNCTYIHVFNEGRSNKQTNKAKKHSTPKAVTFPKKKMSCLEWDSNP